MDITASVHAAVTKARTSWLKNSEVLELLEGYEAAGLAVCQEPPMRPAGGQLFLFDRRICRFFRRDGHTWKKKPDGKTIRETHEKLKVGNAETLNCYYAHADQDDGLQRRCYWQLDPDREHIVLVHYLCCASSRVGSQRGAAAAEARDDGERRPQRASRAHGRRTYSPSPARRRGLAQAKLSPMATSSSLGSDLLEGAISREASVVGLPPMPLGLDAAALPPMPAPHPPYALPQQGVPLAAPPPPFLQPAAPPQQFAAPAAPGLQQQYTVVQQQFAPPPAQFAGLLAGRSSSVVSAASGAGVDADPFALGSAADLQRPHAGVLYTDQRVATQLAGVQQPVVSAPLQPAISAPAHSATLPPRPLLQQESFSAEHHRGLFREMSLGIQKEGAEDGFFLGSPTAEGEALAGDKAAAGTPGGDLAALLASPPHGGAHRRSFSRQGSGLSRLISKNWESDVMEMMLPSDVDADVSAYPVGQGLVVEVAERPTSPSSRLFDQAGIAFFGSAQGSGSLAAAAAAAVQSALEPSPLGASPLSPAPAAALGAGAADAARQLPFASPAPLGASPPVEVQFAAGDAHALAQRAAVHSRLQRSSGGVVPRSGSHTHLALLGKRPGGAAETSSEEERRKERVDAAASAAASVAQEHRDERLAAARGMRLPAADGGEAEDEAAEMIDVPENLQRLTSFLRGGVGSSSGGRLTMGRELAAAEAVADLEQTTRSLLKHMSIDEVDAVAAVRDVNASREVDKMPTIWASSDVDAASQLSEEQPSSRGQSVSSLLEGMHVNVSVNGGVLDAVDEKLQAAMAQHAARQAR